MQSYSRRYFLEQEWMQNATSLVLEDAMFDWILTSKCCNFFKSQGKMCVDVIIHNYSLYIKSGVFTHKWADVHLHALNKWENVLSTMYNVYVSSLLLSEWGYNEAQFQHVPTMFRMTNTFLNTKLTDIAFNRGENQTMVQSWK